MCFFGKKKRLNYAGKYFYNKLKIAIRVSYS
jgi:hypothetical protein